MAEIDILSIMLPAIIAGAISFILIGVKKLGQTSEGTLSGTIRLEHVSVGMKELEKRIEREFEKIDVDLNSIWRKLNEQDNVITLSKYRLDRLEKNNSNGGKGAL